MPPGKTHDLLDLVVMVSIVIDKVHCDDGCHVSAAVIILVSVTRAHSLNQHPGLWLCIWQLKGLKNQDCNL